MDFCRWVYGLHKNSPKEVTKEFVDECFVKLCCLVKTQIDEATKSGTKYVFGQISGDSFHQDDEGNWEFKRGRKEMEYCPADELPNLSTDLFALGVVLYELIKGKSFYNEKEILLGLPFEYEDLCVELKQEGKCSLLDMQTIPSIYEEFGYILQELTQIKQEDRISDFDEFPAAEYVVDFVEAGTGKKLKDSVVYVLEDIDQNVQLDRTISVSGNEYELIKGSMEQLRYSFLKKRIRLMYRKV